MFDCVMPTRNARNGQAFTRHGQARHQEARYRTIRCRSTRTALPGCRGGYSRAYLRHLYLAGEILAAAAADAAQSGLLCAAGGGGARGGRRRLRRLRESALARAPNRTRRRTASQFSGSAARTGALGEIPMSEKKQLGKILLRQRALSSGELERALAEKKGGRLASRLAAAGRSPTSRRSRPSASSTAFPASISADLPAARGLDLLPREIAEKHLILPVLVRDDRLFIAMANPREKKVIDELEFVTGKKVYPYVALEARSPPSSKKRTEEGAREHYYVGPHARGDTRQAPHRSSGHPLAPETHYPKPESQRALHAPGVIVDDEVGALSRSEDVEENDTETLSASSASSNRCRKGTARVDVPRRGPAPKTILVVDDETEIRSMLARLLTRAGYHVVEADGAHRAPPGEGTGIDLIVLDAMLPEVHGFDIARRIKGSKRYGRIPIMMVSAVYRGWRYAEDLGQNLRRR